MADAIAISALCLSLVALILACLSISFIVGFKNSTHKIEWKPLPVDSEADPFAEDKSVNDLQNLWLKNKFKPHVAEPEKEEEPFLDLDDPNQTSNFPF